MICNLTIGATVIELAGGLGRTSETSGLRIGIEPTFERVAYIGVNEARQYARPGASVSVSFDSSQTFSTLALAEAYILGLPAELIDQTGATAEIGQESDGLLVSGTTSPEMDGIVLPLAELQEGKAAYSTGGFDTPGDDPFVLIVWTESAGGFWTIKKATAGVFNNTDIFTSTDDVATPDLVTTWVAGGAAAGIPVVTGDLLDPSLIIYDAEAIVTAAHQGATVRLSVNITGRLTAP